MTCREARACIDLTRPDELSPAEWQAMETHLAACPTCRAERMQALSLGAAMLRLRAEHAAQVTPDIGDAVMRRTLPHPPPVRAPRPLRAVRYTLSAASLLLLGLLVYQSWSDARRLSAFEDGLARCSSADATPTAVAGMVPSFFGPAISRAQRGDRERFFDHLSREYPELARITLDNGLTPAERDMLRAHGARLMQEVDSLLHIGAADHDN
jgi:hypothetical protein